MRYRNGLPQKAHQTQKPQVLQKGKRRPPQKQRLRPQTRRNPTITCYHPVPAWRSRTPNKNGRIGITFNILHGWKTQPLSVPCGKCPGCRLERSRQWAVRIMHEAQIQTERKHENTFLTLTYATLKSPSLIPKDHTDFMKRLRRKYVPENRYNSILAPRARAHWFKMNNIRYYMCGEYGDDLGRPHYHSILFNHRFDDERFFKLSKSGNKLYTSKKLTKLWKHGHAYIGSVTFQSAGYVARYVMKKQTGLEAESHYTPIDPETGEWHKLEPEYNAMSLKPGIGFHWFETYKSEVYPSDFIVMNDVKQKPPKYYDKLLERTNPDLFASVVQSRIDFAKTQSANNTPARLATREAVLKSRLKRLPRNLEE